MAPIIRDKPGFDRSFFVVYPTVALGGQTRTYLCCAMTCVLKLYVGAEMRVLGYLEVFFDDVGYGSSVLRLNRLCRGTFFHL